MTDGSPLVSAVKVFAYGCPSRGLKGDLDLVVDKRDVGADERRRARCVYPPRKTLQDVLAGTFD
jgi:hypothetical protein